MVELKYGKILVFSDLHLGIKSDSFLRLDVAEEFIDYMVNNIKRDKIKTVLFLGDWHHTRPSIAVETMCRSIRMIKKITKHAKLIFVLGNHDIRDNVSTEVNSVRYLDDIEGVMLVDKPTEMMFGENKVLLCPWLSDLSEYEKESYDALFGHFDISNKYLIESYMEDHLSENISTAEVSNLMLKSGYELGITETIDTNSKPTKINSKKHIGKFVNLCKKGGYIYSGHIHHRRTFKIRKRNFTFVGSPMQLTWGDHNKEAIHSNRGYYILDTKTMESKFVENNVSPVHRKYFISELPLETNTIEDIFTKSEIENNFVRLILNKQFDFNKLSEIITLINNYGPKEPCVVDYDFSIDFTEEGSTPENISMHTSKLDYIMEYVDSLEEEIFDNFNVNSDTIKKYIEKYFKFTEEQLA